MNGKKRGGEAQIVRVRLPREGEVVGVVEQMLGASRLLVKCKDNNTRVVRIPGRLKRKLWIKEGDTVIVKPWVVQGNEKGDIAWRYTAVEADRLRREGKL